MTERRAHARRGTSGVRRHFLRTPPKERKERDLEEIEQAKRDLKDAKRANRRAKKLRRLRTKTAKIDAKVKEEREALFRRYTNNEVSVGDYMRQSQDLNERMSKSARAERKAEGYLV